MWLGRLRAWRSPALGRRPASRSAARTACHSPANDRLPRNPPATASQTHEQPPPSNHLSQTVLRAPTSPQTTSSPQAPQPSPKQPPLPPNPTKNHPSSPQTTVSHPAPQPPLKPPNHLPKQLRPKQPPCPKPHPKPQSLYKPKQIVCKTNTPPPISIWYQHVSLFCFPSAPFLLLQSSMPGMDFTEAYSDRCSAVGLAAREGNVEILRELINRGYSVDVPDNRRWLPIHEAAAHNSSECLKLLIDTAPADDYIHSRTFEGLCPLHLSARHGSVECLRVLLEAGADLDNVTTESATTPLFLAVENKHAEVVKFLLQHGANVEGSHSWSGWNSLHQASFQGSTEIMQMLLEKGASKDCRDDFGITPLFVAAQYGRLESLRLLLSHGADVNCQAKDRATPLLIAAQEGHLACVELLLTAGADPNLYCNEDNWQLPIHAAAEMGHAKILELLIPLTDRICDKGEGKVSPVYSALYGGDGECLEMLLKQGFSPDAQECLDFGCRSPMCMIFQKGYYQFVDVLLKYGITLLGINLAHCLRHGKFALFRRFLRLGCSLPSVEELMDFNHSTVQKEYKEWLPWLLLAGFNPVNFKSRFWVFSMSEDVLNFILEFTNWSRLPPVMEQRLSQYKEKFTWTSKSHFAFLPSLSHLCRLEIRSLLGSERLRSERVIRELPLPACLQDYLLYLDVLRANAIPDTQDSLGQGEEGVLSGHPQAEDMEEGH